MCAFLLSANLLLPLNASVRKLDGGFVQLWNGSMPANWGSQNYIDYAAYTRDLYSKLKLRWIVIQNTTYSSDGREAATDTSGKSGNYVSKTPQGVDPIDKILEVADTMNPAMHTFLGLEYNADLMKSLDSDEMSSKLTRQKSHDVQLAKLLQAHYGVSNRRSFDGWYISTEIGNYDWTNHKERIGAFKAYITEVANACYKERHLPVAISTYFNPRKENLSPGKAADQVAEIIKNAPISYLIVQDGAGAFQNKPAAVEAFATSLRQVLQKQLENGTVKKIPTIVGDIELFDIRENGATTVATTPELVERLITQSKSGSKIVLGYDVFNFMNPTYKGDDKDKFGNSVITGHPFQERKRLCNDYALKILQSTSPIFREP